MAARLLASILFLVTAIPAAFAADVTEACYGRCAAQNLSNVEYKACLARAADAADAQLNAAYGELKSAGRHWAKEMGQRPDHVLESPTGAQKKWIAYRDANCSFEDELAFGGTATGGNYAGCLCALGLERMQDFARVQRQLISAE